VSAETLQKNIEQMGRQIKTLEKDLETFPPPQSDKDFFSQKMSISFHAPTACPVTSLSSSAFMPHKWGKKVKRFDFRGKVTARTRYAFF